MRKNVDVIVGKKIRSQRIAMGMSQSLLAERVGVTFQQIQKYESGASSLNVFRISTICQALKVPASFFFDDDISRIGVYNFPINSDKDNPVSDRELLEIAKSVQQVNNPAIRKKIVDLLRSIVESGQ